jgi:hypothetical protein
MEKINKEEIMSKMRELYNEHEFKKSVIKKILDDLDEKSSIGEEHFAAFKTINEIFSEMDELALKQEELRKQITNK